MLIPAERRNAIYEILRSQGIVRVSALSARLNVSEITIRRDLELMEADGLLERTHGGAVFNQHIHLEPRYSEKHRTHQVEKRCIGAAASSLIEDSDTLFINSGSTTLQIFRYMSERQNLKIITSNMGAFLEIQPPDLDLIMIGGLYRPQSNSLVGELAMLCLQQVYAGKCFIGVDGISLKYGVTTPNVQEAAIARMMIERTRGLVVVVADHSKFGVVADFVTAPLEKVHVLVTDSGIHSEHVQSLQERGIRVLIAEAQQQKID